jgi:uncharacterized membrane protein
MMEAKITFGSSPIRKAGERTVEMIILVPTLKRATGRAVLRALDDLAAANAIEIQGAALLERSGDGRWHIPEETENLSYRGKLTGGVIGAMIELLSGPGGQLFGGAAVRLARSSAVFGDDIETIVHALARLISPGVTAVVCDVCETTSEAVDRALGGFGLSGWRIARDEAEVQLSAALHRTVAG